jgi:hypothetical protein
MESVKTISSSALFCTRSEAGPDITQCEAMARTLLAPLAIMRSAALVMVPAVSTMSSTRTTSAPFTSPMICMSDTSLAFFLVLLQSTRGQLRYLA